MYSKYVFDDKLISPINGKSFKRLNAHPDTIKNFGFDSIEDLHNKYPEFPLICKITRNSRSKKGKLNSQYGFIWVTNFQDKISKKINSSELNYYLSLGWKKKRVFDFTNYDINGNKTTKPTKKKNKKPNKNMLILALKILNKNCYNESDIKLIRKTIYYDLYSLFLSPSQIAKKYDIDYSNFGMFIKSSLKIPLRSTKDALINYNTQIGKTVTDLKKLYWIKCSFSFNVYNEKRINGYSLLSKYKFPPRDHKLRNPNEIYIHRDHMVSISYGYENNIPPEHISHPANCEILTEKDNLSKKKNCSITYKELLIRINNWDKTKQ